MKEEEAADEKESNRKEIDSMISSKFLTENAGESSTNQPHRYIRLVICHNYEAACSRRFLLLTMNVLTWHTEIRNLDTCCFDTSVFCRIEVSKFKGMSQLVLEAVKAEQQQQINQQNLSKAQMRQEEAAISQARSAAADQLRKDLLKV